MSTEGKCIADDIVSGLCTVTKLWAKQRKQEERHASARANRHHRLLRSRQETIKTALQLLTLIVQKHKPVADLFCSDAGVTLMNIDAEITLRAVQQCQTSGIAVLPVHDSLIVPARYAGTAAEIMERAFATRFPGRTCIIR
jgi:hypothetical protein